MNGEISFTLLVKALNKAGASAIAAVRADEVATEDRCLFRQWLESGRNAGMEYMHNWPELRFDPREMHPETRFVISVAFPYTQNLTNVSQIASYALFDDYHKVIPKRIKEAMRGLENDFCNSVRICVDSAPVRERYWAVKSGLATRCDSGLVSIPGLGTRFFLAEILTPFEITGVEPFVYLPRTVRSGVCDHCGMCRKACPGSAILEDGTIDAERCVSYLTIEHKGEWSAEQKEIMARPASRHTLFGCEICQRVCHLNRHLPAADIPQFTPREELLNLTKEKVLTLTPESFAAITRGTPLKRTGLVALKRNASSCETDKN